MNYTHLDLTKLSTNQIKILNQISIDLKPKFNGYVREIYSSFENLDIYNIVNVILSRNNYISTFFIDLCFLELVRTNINDDLKLIITPNKRLKNTLEKYILKNRLNIKVKCKSSIKNIFQIYLMSFKNFVYIILYSLNLVLTRRKNRYDFNSKIPIILIDTYLASVELKNNYYDSRYFPRKYFWDKIKDKRKSNIFFVPEYNMSFNELIKLKLYKLINVTFKSDINFIYKNDFLKINDYKEAIIKLISQKKPNFSAFKHFEFDLKEILDYDFKMNRFNHQSYLGILNYKFFKRLKEKRVKIEKIISWFENQPNDKGFALGTNNFFPKSKLVGFQNFNVSYNYFHYFSPTRIENKLKLVPNTIYTISKNNIDKVKQFDKTLDVRKGPAIRFSHIHKKINKIENNSKIKTVFICLPFHEQLSRNILSICSTIINNRKIKIYIKAHPSSHRSRNLFSNFKGLMQNSTIVKGDLSSYFNKIDIFISAGASPCLESICYGIPTIVIGSSTDLDQNPIDNKIPDKLWKICYNNNEFNLALNEYINYNDKTLNELSLIGQDLRESLFCKPTTQQIENFIFN